MPIEETYLNQPVEEISVEILPTQPTDEEVEGTIQEIAIPEEAIPIPTSYELADLYFSNDFYNRVNLFKEENIIAYFLILLSSRNVLSITREFINYLGVSNDDATKISYLDKSKIERRINEGYGVYDYPETRYHASAAKTIRKLLGCVFIKDIQRFEYVFNDLKYWYAKNQLPIPEDLEQKSTLLDLVLERDIDAFNNRYRLEGFKQFDSVDVQIVKGNDIRHFYHEENYASLSGTLGNSCMRYSCTQKYLDIYVMNTSICSLAVIVDSKGKLQARCLLWTIDDQIYFDRIYSSSDIVSDKMRSDFLTRGYVDCYSRNRNLTIESFYDPKELNKKVKLYFEFYPYMDTFKYLSPNCSSLSTFEPEDKYYCLNRTGGDYQVCNEDCEDEEDSVECAACGHFVHTDESCFVDFRGDSHHQDNLCTNCATYSVYHSSYITGEESIHSLSGGIVHQSEAVELRDGEFDVRDNVVELVDGTYAQYDEAEETVEGNYVVLGEEAFEDWVMCKDGIIRRLEDCIRTRNDEYIQDIYAIEHEGEIWERDELDVHLANLSII